MWARSFRRARSRKSSRSTANSSRITPSTRRFGQMNSRHANDCINDGGVSLPAAFQLANFVNGRKTATRGLVKITTHILRIRAERLQLAFSPVNREIPGLIGHAERARMTGQ
jgi:hypothetical protein